MRIIYWNRYKDLITIIKYIKELLKNHTLHSIYPDIRNIDLLFKNIHTQPQLVPEIRMKKVLIKVVTKKRHQAVGTFRSLTYSGLS